MTTTVEMQRPYTVTAGASPVPLSGTTRTALSVALRFPSGNTAAVIVGDQNIVATDPGFDPDTSITITAAPRTVLDLNKIYVLSASGSQAVDVFVQA